MERKERERFPCLFLYKSCPTSRSREAQLRGHGNMEAKIVVYVAIRFLSDTWFCQTQ